MPNDNSDDSIPGSNGEGWDFFAAATDKAMDQARERLELEQKEIDRTFSRVFATTDGQIILKYLQHLQEGVEDFEPALGFYNGAALGFWRTGQRAYLKFIKNAIIRGGKA